MNRSRRDTSQVSLINQMPRLITRNNTQPMSTVRCKRISYQSVAQQNFAHTLRGRRHSEKALSYCTHHTHTHTHLEESLSCDIVVRRGTKINVIATGLVSCVMWSTGAHWETSSCLSCGIPDKHNTACVFSGESTEGVILGSEDQIDGPAAQTANGSEDIGREKFLFQCR